MVIIIDNKITHCLKIRIDKRKRFIRVIVVDMMAIFYIHTLTVQVETYLVKSKFLKL